jgi:threonine aldolase
MQVLDSRRADERSVIRHWGRGWTAGFATLHPRYKSEPILAIVSVPGPRIDSMIDYRSDNTGRAAPEILDAMVRANTGTALGYGADEWTAKLQERFSELFETQVRVFPVATGTAANALALAATSPSWGLVYCSEAAHINTSEANAAGFFGGGLKLVPVAGNHGRIDPDAFARTLASVMPGQLHRGQPAAVNITQASDLGTVYPLDDIRAIAEVAKGRGLKIHMDGARFANALARLRCSPAEASWRAGVDILSFGATKNGGALCDAIVVFSPELADGLAVQLRRAGQVWSKMRFASAQLMAYIEEGLWLRLATASNAVAARIAAGIARLPGLRLVAPVEVNELFLELPSAAMDALEHDGFQFYRRSATLARFVCRFDTSEAETDALIATLRRHCAAQADSSSARAAE